VTYYEVPQEYAVREYRYTVVNDRPVLVDPALAASLRSSSERGSIKRKLGRPLMLSGFFLC
jgi:hypothetical protein